MLLSLDGVWDQWMTLALVGAIVTSLLLAVACTVGGLCADGREGSQRKAL